MSRSADPHPSSASAVTDPTTPATSTTVAPDGTLMLDVADSRVSSRAPGIPRDVRAKVRAEGLTRAESGRATLHSLGLVLTWSALSIIGLGAGRWFVWVPVWFAQAILLRGAYVAMHEAAHGTMYRSRLANRVAGLLWSVPLLVNASLWRAWHLEHHRATLTDEDPESAGKVTNLARYVVAFPFAGLRTLVSAVLRSLGLLVGLPPAYAKRFGMSAAMFVDAVVLIVVIIGVATAAVLRPDLVLALWAIPFLGYWLVAWVFLGLAEHHGTSSTGGMLEVTRTVESWPVTRFIVWNSNYHAAHHLVPSVSYRHLPRLDEILGERTVHRSPSFVRHHLHVVRDLLPGRGKAGPEAEPAEDRESEAVGVAS